MAGVQAVIYLVFNEGYAATTGKHLIRKELCAEAIRLGRVLCEPLPPDAENLGLLALLLLQDSRRSARINSRGHFVPLEDQDRLLWDHNEIAEGLELVQRALHLQRIGSYQLQATIAAVHARAKTAAETDWREISVLYDALAKVSPSPVVALNHAVAVGMSGDLEQGLALIDQLGSTGNLDEYYLFHAARADLLRRLDRPEEAKEAYSRALELTTNEVEQAFLRRRLMKLASH